MTAAADIARACIDAGQPEMAPLLLAEGIDLDVARGRLDHVGMVRNMIALAARLAPHLDLRDLELDAIETGKPIRDVCREIFDKLADADAKTHVDGHRLTGDGAAAAATEEHRA